jgi:hypothetical protein
LNTDWASDVCCPGRGESESTSVIDLMIGEDDLEPNPYEPGRGSDPEDELQPNPYLAPWIDEQNPYGPAESGGSASGTGSGSGGGSGSGDGGGGLGSGDGGGGSGSGDGGGGSGSGDGGGSGSGDGGGGSGTGDGGGSDPVSGSNSGMGSPDGDDGIPHSLGVHIPGAGADDSGEGDGVSGGGTGHNIPGHNPGIGMDDTGEGDFGAGATHYIPGHNPGIVMDDDGDGALYNTSHSSGQGTAGDTEIAAGTASQGVENGGENGNAGGRVVPWFNPGIYMSGADVSASHSGALTTIAAHGGEQAFGIADSAHANGFWAQAAEASHLGTIAAANYSSTVDLAPAASSIATPSSEYGQSTSDAGTHEQVLAISAVAAAHADGLAGMHANFELEAPHAEFGTQMHL